MTVRLTGFKHAKGARASFGAPSYADAEFTLVADAMTIEIRVR